MLHYFPITGRLVMTDDTAGAHLIFDSDDSFLCVHPSDFRTGSQVVPARTASSQGVDGSQVVVDTEVDYFLASIAIPGARIVRGMMRVTWDSSPEPGDNVWRQASGTHLDILDGVSVTGKPQSDLGGYNRVATLGGYTFLVDEVGNLILRERLVMRARDPGGPPTSFNRARQQATISFRLLIGFFLRQDWSVKPGLAHVDTQRAAAGVSTTKTITGMPCGFAFTGRLVIVVARAIINGGGNTPIATSATIGGVTATIHGGVAGINAGGSLTIASAVVPSATSVDVAFTYASSIALFDASLYAGKNIASAGSVGGSASGASPIATSLSASASQIGLVAAAANSAEAPEITNTVSLRSFNSFGTAVVPPGSGSVSASASWPTSAGCTIAAVVFS